MSRRLWALCLLLAMLPAATAEDWLNWYPTGSILELDDLLVVASDTDGRQAGALTTTANGNHGGGILGLSMMSADWGVVSQAELVLSTSGNFGEFMQVDLRELLAAPPQGEWVELVVPSGQWNATAGSDLATVNALIVRIRSHDGQTALVAFRDIAFLQPTLDRGVVTIAFDDARSDVHDYAFAQLTERELTATVYAIPGLVDTPTYMTEEQLRELNDNGWEIAAHGEDRLTDLTYAERNSQFRDVIDWFRERGWSARPNYAYPEGAYSEEVIRHVSLYFRTARTIHTSSNVPPHVSQYRLGAVSAYPGMTLEELQDLALAAADSGEWITFVFHLFSEDPAFDTQFPQDRFEAFLDFLVDNDIRVLTAQQAWELNLSAGGCSGAGCN